MSRIVFVLGLVASVFAGVGGAKAADETPITVSTAERTADGEWLHRLQSPYQAGETQLRILLPQHRSADERFRVLFVLPVEAGREHKYGDGLAEVRRLDIHNRFKLICAAPTFSHLPWYVDHPTDSTIRQESHFMRAIVPLVDEHYPTTRCARDRLLLGFSKSGWGACALLLRHPEMFGKAAAWDAPLMLDAPGRYGSAPIFGTRENFRDYELSELARLKADQYRSSPRLFHFGYANFRADHVQFEALLNGLNIAHCYQLGPQRTHVWGSGWVETAVRWLADDT